MKNRIIRALTVIATLVVLVLTTVPASAATYTVVHNAYDSQSSLVVRNVSNTYGLLTPGQSSTWNYIPTGWFTDYGWCTDMFDHTNGYRRIIVGRYSAGEWANFPWAQHEYTIYKWDC